MSAEVGGNKNGPVAGMNVVPLIDILLVLIIIFMVITPLAPKGLDTVVPQPSASTDPAVPETVVVVQVLGNDELKINGDAATWESLGRRLADIFKLRAQKVAFVQGGDGVRFAEVARAIDVMRSSNIERVGLLTAKLQNLQ
jgi:biopolymer transport protein ExbD